MKTGTFFGESAVKMCTLNPIWKEAEGTFATLVDDEHDAVIVALWDKDPRDRDDVLGFVRVRISSLLATNASVDETRWYPVCFAKYKYAKGKASNPPQILVRIQLLESTLAKRMAKLNTSASVVRGSMDDAKDEISTNQRDASSPVQLSGWLLTSNRSHALPYAKDYHRLWISIENHLLSWHVEPEEDAKGHVPLEGYRMYV